jgi:hypothetical protein
MYEIFSDESGHERYRTIAALSGHANHLKELREKINLIYLDKNIQELEWKNLNEG